ncbi:hypothetical protein EJ110_NYTH33902 [Nymphaea thermarum]|nr:hypothetical protein EJ110_NYTH33902 [Nymphaea thermarum]
MGKSSSSNHQWDRDAHGGFLRVDISLLHIRKGQGKWHVWSIMIPTVIIFLATALISWCSFSEHHQRKVVVGSVGLATSIAMYGSPLVVVKLVIKTKSVEFMPFYLSLFSFLASSLWLAYGLVGRDLFVAVSLSLSLSLLM